MKKIATVLATTAVLALGSSVTQAQEIKGAYFYNGLVTNIVEAYVARQEKCDIFLCGKWARVDNPDRVMAPHTEAGLFKLPSGDPGAEVVCKWDLKIVTQPPEGGATEEHVFSTMDFCPPRAGSTVSFTQGRFNVFAVQVYKDESGQEQSVTFASAK